MLKLTMYVNNFGTVNRQFTKSIKQTVNQHTSCLNWMLKRIRSAFSLSCRLSMIANSSFEALFCTHYTTMPYKSHYIEYSSTYHTHCTALMQNGDTTHLTVSSFNELRQTHLETEHKVDAVFLKWINVIQYQRNDDVQTIALVTRNCMLYNDHK